MSIEILSIHHASFIVKSLDNALDFYCGLLNLEIDTSRPEDMPFNGVWLKVGANQQIHLLELDNPDSTTGRPTHGGRDRHAAFLVKDIKLLSQAFDTQEVTYTLSKSGRLALFVRDPDGNALEFIQA